jgi:sugar phosphate isomerase/epimerase
MSEPDLVAVLLELAECADCVVMHPDTMQNPTLYEALGRKLVIENMDAGKRDGCNVDQLERWFAALPHAGFCFDVAHAWSIDPTMGLASELLDAFRSRIRHLHVSSLSPELHHVPLTLEDEEQFMPVLERCLDLPWILEAPPRDI